MKIMILVPSFGKASPIEGAFLFAKYLHEQGKDVIFVSLDANYHSKVSIIDKIVGAGIDYECLNIKRWWGLWYYSYVQKYCKKQGIDVVLAYELRPALIASTLHKVVKIAFVRGMLREAYLLQYPYGKIVINFFTNLHIKALKKMDHVFSMTKPMTSWLGSEGISLHKISLVKNCVDVRVINSSVSPYGLKNKSVLNIGLFCMFVPRKRVDVALNAVHKLAYGYRNSNIKLHIAGSGPLKDELERKANDLKLDRYVVFHGFLENPIPLMQEMDLVLLTSESEGTPRCLMEALSLGKTCISSDINGVRELIQDKQTGYLFPVGNVEELASLIDNIIRNKLYLPSERLVNFMLESHDIDGCCGKMLCKIEQVFENKKSYVSCN